MGCGRGFLDHGSILLGRLIHLADGTAHLLQALGLFARPAGDLDHHAGDIINLRDNTLQRRGCFADKIHTHIDLAGRVIDEALDLLGGLGRALGQRTHLRSDHRKATTGLAGTRRLHARVEGEQVGLEGDLIDHADDLRDLLGGLRDAMHGIDGAVDHDARGISLFLRAEHDLLGVARTFRGLVHRGRDLFQRGSRFFKAGCLLFGPTRHVVCGRGHVETAGADCIRADLDRLDGVAQLLDRQVEVLTQPVKIAREADIDAIGQVAIGEAAQGFSKTRDRLLHEPGLLRLLGFAGNALGICTRCFLAGQSLKAHLLDGCVTEDHDCAGHVADFVAIVLSRNGDLGIAASQGGHHLGDQLYWTANAATDDPAKHR